MLTPIENFYKQTVARRWSTAIAGNFYVTELPESTTGFLTISPSNESLREIVYFSNTGSDENGNYITIAEDSHRGMGGTTAQTHEVGEPVRMNITAQHWDEVDDKLTNLITIEHTVGATHSLTTVANEKVIVWARGVQSGGGAKRTVSLKYDGVTKDSIEIDSNADGTPVFLMYTETPGAATEDITVTTSGNTLDTVIITVMKIKY